VDAPQISLEDILQEASDTDVARRAAAAAEAVRGREPSLPRRLSRGNAPDIVSVPAPLQSRLRTLLALEGALAEDGLDHSPLVFLACQLCEIHLRDTLEPLGRVLAPELLGAIEDARTPRHVLEKWSTGQAPCTLGTVELLVFALRRALERSVPRVPETILGRFTPDYLTLVRSRGPERALSRLRNEHRNPVAHGLTTVSSEGYEKVCGLLLGARLASSWCARGPAKTPVPHDVAVLHHHLALGRAS
jgi:hypothetical protein